jgi:hypothetical protein
MSKNKPLAEIKKQYEDSNGDDKYALGIHYAHKLWFEEYNEAMAKEIIREIDILREKQDKPMSEKVREWVDVTELPFRVTQIYDALQTVTDREQRQKDRNNIRMILHRLKEDGYIQSYGGVEGVYRKSKKEFEALQLGATSSDGIKFHLPFGMDKLGIKLFNGNIITIAGQKSAGKTALCLAIAKHNRDIIKTQYASSEMWDDEMTDRALLHDDMTVDEWNKVEFIHCSDNFADAVKKDWLNIFDFVELGGEALYKVGDRLKEIHDALGGTGLAMVALQLDPGKEIARGGPSALDKPRLILTLKSGSTKKLGTLKIYDAKNLKKGASNPSGKIIHFKLVQGSVFLPQGTWHYDEDCSEETCGVAGKKGTYS